jgi:predicted phage tail component-like protein
VIGTFEFNSIVSSDFDIVTKSINRPLFPTMTPRTIEIFGKNGLYDYGANTYSTRKITVQIQYIGTSFVELRQRARDIAAWLRTTTWGKLIFDDEPDKFYYARVYGQIDFENLRRLGTCSVEFECQPFAFCMVDTGDDLTWDDFDAPWMVEGITWVMSSTYTKTVTGNTSFVFDNPGTVNIGNDAPQGGKFDIVITGTWTTITLAVNGKTLTFSQAGASATLTIDNIEMECDVGGTNKLSYLSGDVDTFLHLIPGTNTITITGTGMNFSILVDFTPMWI